MYILTHTRHYYPSIGIDYVKKYNVAINKDFFVVNRKYNLNNSSNVIQWWLGEHG